MESDPNFELEYKSLAENVRWWSNLRFAQLTLFVVLMAALFSTVNNPNLELPNIVMLGLKLGGLFTSFVFYYLEFRANEYWTHFINRAAKIEASLGFKQFSERPIRKIRTSYLLRLFFIGIAVYWLFTLIAPCWLPNLI